MKFGDVTIKTTNDGVEYLELTERASKTMDGSRKNDHRDVAPKIFTPPHSAPNENPINIFKLFCSHRPYDAMHDESPMYLTPIPEKRLTFPDSVWYYKTPMGVNTLGNLLKKACQNAGVQGKKTNHSLRKSTVAELSSAGIPPHKIIKITGHRNVQSLQHYDKDLNLKEHQNISEILCEPPKKIFRKSTSGTVTDENASATGDGDVIDFESGRHIPRDAEPVSPSTNKKNNETVGAVMDQILSGAVFNNCTNITFNFALKK